MYAINHAATALVLRKKYPTVPTALLLVSVQLVEVLWVVFNYLGLEHTRFAEGRLHLDFLPYSHSLLSGGLLAALTFTVFEWGFRNRSLAVASALGVMSHVVIDLLFHEPDIRLSPFTDLPAFGLGIIHFPLLDFTLELLYGLACWWYFGGSRSLLIAIVAFNLIDLPMMLSEGEILRPFVQHAWLLPSVILLQIVLTAYAVWRYSRPALAEQPLS